MLGAFGAIQNDTILIMEITLELFNEEVLYLKDNAGNIIAQRKPVISKYDQCKRIKPNCNIIRESAEGFLKFSSKSNIYCLDDNLNMTWILNAPATGDSFPNPIVWNKEITREKNPNGFLELTTRENVNTFICSSWGGITVTVNYETGEILDSELTK